MSIKVVVPRVDKDEIYDGLVSLTKLIHDLGKADGSAGGFLGGEFGYGANFENSIFMMHRYCWCEQDDCPWCGGDAGPLSNHSGYFSSSNTTMPNFIHKPSKSAVWWYKYIGRGMEIELKAPWREIVRSCSDSLES